MIRYMLSWVRAKLPINERGQDLVEYALLSGMIALAIIGVSALFLTGALTDMVTGIGYCVDFDTLTTCDPF